MTPLSDSSPTPAPPGKPYQRTKLVLIGCFFILTSFVVLPTVFTFLHNRDTPFSVHEGKAMGTTWQMKLHWENKIREAVDEANTLVRQQLEDIDAMCSTWRDDSQLMQFNQSRDEAAHPVSKPLATLVEQSQTIARMTNGAFDPTVGSLTRHWINDEARRITQAANPTAHIASDKLVVSTDPPTLQKSDPELALDLSAIAKGYALDLIHQALHDQPTLPSGYLELGGEVRTWGPMPTAVAVEAPVIGRREVLTVVELRNQAMATSGDYRQRKVVDGETVTHIIDPRTGKPIDHELASATVVHDSCATADALATALMVMGPEQGMAFAEREDLAVLLVVRDGEAMRVLRSPAWEQRVVERGLSAEQ